MRKIYMITLDDDIPLSDNISSDVREIAYWLYNELNKFDKQIVCINDDEEINAEGLIKNELYDVPSNGNYIYKFSSDNSMIDKYMYEPFIVSDNAFGITVYNDSVSEEEITAILDSLFKLLKFNYNFSISSIVYDESDINNRLEAINKIINKKEDVQKKDKQLVRVRNIPLVYMLN